ncbi:hypothetical protein [Streptomyces sp. NPDC059389]|uniref:hypothetical protein n=1 Tax=Streptomyces sp. NPDC059389 TaxID=3346818 RepID=UPI0036D1CEA6
MTNDKKRKAATRAIQHQSGSRYTMAARHSGPATGPASFQLKALLAESATFPPTEPAWPYDNLGEYFDPPAVFDSHLMGTPVPFYAVLELAGELARSGHAAVIEVESVEPLESATLACEGRRFRLDILWNGIGLLCRATACTSGPYDEFIEWCLDHLPSCTDDEIIAMTEEWGYACGSEHGRAIDRIARSPRADLLIKAATAQGISQRAIEAFLHAAYADPADIDNMFWDETEALAMRHAIEDEQTRLNSLARREAARLRQEAGQCAGCRTPLTSLTPHPSVPPRYCSAGCVPPRPLVVLEPPF